MVASASMIYIAVDYKNKTNMTEAASNINIKIHQLFSKQRILGDCLRDHCTVENLTGIDTDLLLKNVYLILVKITIKLILIFLSNSFFNPFMKMKHEKQTVLRFSFFYENEKWMTALKIQSKNLLNMKIIVNNLNFVFYIAGNTKYKYKSLNFIFQFIKITIRHFGYTDWVLVNFYKSNIFQSSHSIKNFHRTKLYQKHAP